MDPVAAVIFSSLLHTQLLLLLLLSPDSFIRSFSDSSSFRTKIRKQSESLILTFDFLSVISWGSQFKVESVMFRIAKLENFILPSPSKKQVGGQNALECLPLVMEPQSAFYTSPVLVLDFQSLYPSIMIAHNYCYSTYLGRVVSWRGQDKMGFTDYNREPGLLELFKGRINSKLSYGFMFKLL